MTHAFAANFGASDFNATTLANDAFESHALVLTAIAFPVPSRTEDLFAEKTIALWLECAVVNCFWFLDFTM